MRSKPGTGGHRSGAARAVVVVAGAVALALVLPGRSRLRRGGGGGCAVDLGALVGDDASELECAVEVTADLDSAIVVELLGVNLAGGHVYKVTVLAFDDDVCLSLSAEYGLGWLTLAEEATVAEVGVPEGGAECTARGVDVALGRLGAWVGWVERRRRLDDEEVDGLERAD